MTLLPGLRVAVAPNFHLDVDWRERLSLGARIEHTNEGLVTHPPWRPASEEDLAVLTPDPSTSRDELSGCLCLFVVPVHLRSAFWKLLDSVQEQGKIPPDGFRSFVAEVAKFLNFKQCGLP